MNMIDDTTMTACSNRQYMHTNDTQKRGLLALLQLETFDTEHNQVRVMLEDKHQYLYKNSARMMKIQRLEWFPKESTPMNEVVWFAESFHHVTKIDVYVCYDI